MEISVSTVRVDDLPGGAALVVDDQPGSVVLWVRSSLNARETAELISRGMEEIARRGLWVRSTPQET